MVGKRVLPLVVAGHVVHAIVHEVAAVRHHAIVAKRHAILILIVRISTKGEHATIHRKTARVVEVVVHELRLIQMTWHLE